MNECENDDDDDASLKFENVHAKCVGSRVWGVGSRVEGLGFMVLGLGCGV